MKSRNKPHQLINYTINSLWLDVFVRYIKLFFIIYPLSLYRDKIPSYLQDDTNYKFWRYYCKLQKVNNTNSCGRTHLITTHCNQQTHLWTLLTCTLQHDMRLSWPHGPCQQCLWLPIPDRKNPSSPAQPMVLTTNVTARINLPTNITEQWKLIPSENHLPTLHQNWKIHQEKFKYQ